MTEAAIIDTDNATEVKSDEVIESVVAKEKTEKPLKAAKLVKEKQQVTVALEAGSSVETTPKSKQPNQAKQIKPKRPMLKRPSLAERVEQQANPTTRLAGKQKTIVLPLDYASDIIHEYLRLNQSTMLSGYERLAALLRMLSREKDLVTQVNDWIGKNTQIAQTQLVELQAQRSALEEEAELADVPEIKTPDTYKTTFEASHPVATKMVAIARAVDAELVACENLYFAGVIDDNEYALLRDQATTIIRGSVDRIFKATKPGNREGGRFNPADLAKWIREGNRLMFTDIPQKLQYIIDVEAAA